MQVLRKAHNDGSFLPNLEARNVETIVDRSLQNMVERRFSPLSIKDEQVEEMIPLRPAHRHRSTSVLGVPVPN